MLAPIRKVTVVIIRMLKIFGIVLAISAVSIFLIDTPNPFSRTISAGEFRLASSQPTNQIGKNYEDKNGLVLINQSIVDWKKTRVDNLTLEHMIDYLLWKNQSSCVMSQSFGGSMFFVMSKGKDVGFYDGMKSVCLDAEIAPQGRCLVYSFGINNDWSFDEAMESYGCQVYSFDPSMDQPNHKHSPGIQFFRMALDDVDRKGWSHLKDIPSRTLSSIHQMLIRYHDPKPTINYLKMDIEGTEWRVLPQLIRSGMLDKVRQLGFEIHLTKTSIEEIRRQVRIVQSLEDYGMVRFSSEMNIFSLQNVADEYGRNLSVSTAYEIAWYNIRYFENSKI